MSLILLFLDDCLYQRIQSMLYNCKLYFTINYQIMIDMGLSYGKLMIILLLSVESCWLVSGICVNQQTDYSVNYATNGDFQTPYLGPNRWRFTTQQLSGWSSTKIQQGTGSIYNPRWGSNTQVIQLDTDINQQYNKTLILPKGKFLFKISYAARNGAPLSSSGIIIRWNGIVIRDIPVSNDYLIHTQSFLLMAVQGANNITIEGAGTSDGVGMTCDDIIFNMVTSYNRVEVNGSCLCERGYFDDMRHYSCQPCITVMEACQECTYTPGNNTNFNSSSSNSSSLIYSFQCQSCGYGHYNEAGSCMDCSVNQPGCLNCSSDGHVCYSCNETDNYFLDPHMQHFDSANSNITNNSVLVYCRICSLEGCISCNSLTNCSICNNSANYFMNDSISQCQICTLSGCLQCINLTNCLLCDYNSSYYFNSTSSAACDYCNNSFNYFLNLSSLICEQCLLGRCLQCQNLTACEVCVPGLSVLNQSSLLCEPCLIEGCVYCQSATVCKICDEANEYTLEDGQCLKCLSCSCRSGGAIKNDAVPDLLYSEEECQSKNKVKSLTEAIVIISYFIMFFSLISIKIVGLELFGVLQLAYFNLSDHDFVNLYLSPLLSWRYLNGFNFNLNSLLSQPNTVPPNVQAIEYGSSFMANINVMFLVLVLQLLVGIVLRVLSKKFKKLERVGRLFLQEIFITLFLFNSFNIAYSIGLHFKYATPDNSNYYWLSTIIAVLGIFTYLLILSLLQVAKKDEFGEFKEKFKKDCVNQTYISVSVLYRMALGVYMATSNEEVYGTLLILAISLAYILFNVINLPFVDAYQNYRANLCHLTQMVILLVTNYYRSMKHNYPLQSKARLYNAAIIELVLLVVCVVMSFICLGYQIYKTIKSIMQKLIQKRKANKKQKKTQNNHRIYPSNNTEMESQIPHFSFQTMKPQEQQISFPYDQEL